MAQLFAYIAASLTASIHKLKDIYTTQTPSPSTRGNETINNSRRLTGTSIQANSSGHSAEKYEKQTETQIKRYKKIDVVDEDDDDNNDDGDEEKIDSDVENESEENEDTEEEDNDNVKEEDDYKGSDDGDGLEESDGEMDDNEEEEDDDSGDNDAKENESRNGNEFENEIASEEENELKKNEDTGEENNDNEVEESDEEMEEKDDDEENEDNAENTGDKMGEGESADVLGVTDRSSYNHDKCKLNGNSQHTEENFKTNFRKPLEGRMAMEKVVGARNFGKIQYNDLDIIDVRGGVKVCKGNYEGVVEAAIKISPIDPSDVERVNKDFTILNRKLKKTVDINHKLMTIGNDNIVKYFCHEFEIQSANSYRINLLIALERCRCNLYRFMEERPSLPITLNNAIYRQLASGLHFLHSRNIVHRDIKPSNVLVKIDDKAKLIFKLSDFGGAKTATGSESGASVSGPCGTYGWTAPEAHDGKHYFRKSDVFPLGQTFYFIESNKGSVFKNQEDIQRGQANFTHISAKNIPVRNLLEKMLSYNHRGRPSVAEILNHPALWDARRALEFFETAKEILDGNPSGCDIEDNWANVLRGGWQQHLSEKVERHLFPTVRGQQNKKPRKGPAYKRRSVQSLIRAVRNNKTHFQTLPDDVKREFGAPPENYLKYWTRRFPELLMHTYKALVKLHSKYDRLDEFYP